MELERTRESNWQYFFKDSTDETATRFHVMSQLTVDDIDTLELFDKPHILSRLEDVSDVPLITSGTFEYIPSRPEQYKGSSISHLRSRVSCEKPQLDTQTLAGALVQYIDVSLQWPLDVSSTHYAIPDESEFTGITLSHPESPDVADALINIEIEFEFDQIVITAHTSFDQSNPHETKQAIILALEAYAMSLDFCINMPMRASDSANLGAFQFPLGDSRAYITLELEHLYRSELALIAAEQATRNTLEYTTNINNREWSRLDHMFDQLRLDDATIQRMCTQALIYCHKNKQALTTNVVFEVAQSRV